MTPITATPVRRAGRVVLLGVVACMVAMLFAAPPASANFAGCSSAPVGPCETVNGNHRMVYYVIPGAVNHTYFWRQAHAQLWYQVPNGPQVSIWSSNPSGNPAYDAWLPPGGSDTGSRVDWAKYYLNKAYPENTRLCTRLWVLNGSSHYDAGSSCAWIKY